MSDNESSDQQEADTNKAAYGNTTEPTKRGKCRMGWGLLWFVMIIVIAWPLSLFVSVFYVVLMPFGVCVPAIHELCDILLKLMQCPLTFAENLIRCAPVDCSDPLEKDGDDGRP